jgi:antitoxin component of MazEF toxin-antitoxin module
MKVQRLRKSGNSYAVVVPADVRRELKWWESDQIELHVQDGMLVLCNATQHDVTPIRRQKFHDGNQSYSD